MICTGCKVTAFDYFTKTYKNQEKLLEFLLTHSLVASVIRCELCNAKLKIKWKDDNIVYECNTRHKEGQKFSQNGRRNTFMEKSILSIPDIMAFFVFWCQIPYPRQKFLQSELGWTTKTVRSWSSFCREVCKSWVFENCQKIGGPNKVVELSEAKFGKMRQCVRGQWVCGAVQRDDKSKFFLIPVESRGSRALVDLIEGWILPGTTIVSNCRKTCGVLVPEDRAHLKENLGIEYLTTRKNGDDGILEGNPLIHTRNINRQWRNVRYSIPVLGRKKRDIAGYLAEHLFKVNHPRPIIVHAFLEAIGNLYPPPVEEYESEINESECNINESAGDVKKEVISIKEELPDCMEVADEETSITIKEENDNFNYEETQTDSVEEKSVTKIVNKRRVENTSAMKGTKKSKKQQVRKKTVSQRKVNQKGKSKHQKHETEYVTGNSNLIASESGLYVGHEVGLNGQEVKDEWDVPLEDNSTYDSEDEDVYLVGALASNIIQSMVGRPSRRRVANKKDDYVYD